MIKFIQGITIFNNKDKIYRIIYNTQRNVTGIQNLKQVNFIIRKDKWTISIRGKRFDEEI